MPAPGEQHLSAGGKTVSNPFEEVKPRISEYTAQEIATLQSRLEKQLGPEYISSRAGPGGQKVWYLAAEKCIQLANEVFGFNGWSSQIMDVQVDFIDENPQTMKVSLGLSVIVRVTLRDGTYHEDVGYGHMENAKGKAAAFEKAKKEGTTDGLKRALRNFGNVLGNCIYDKDYLGKVTKIKAPPTKFEVEKLHRHSDFTPVKKESEAPKAIDDKSQNSTGAIAASLISEDTFDDEFGDFDDADFGAADPDAHPDEVILPPQPETSRHSAAARNTTPGINGRPLAQVQNHSQNLNRPPVKQPMAAPPPKNQGPLPPQTPNSGFSRSAAATSLGMRPQSDSRPAQLGQAAPTIIGNRVLNQPSRTGPGSGPNSAPPSPACFNPSADDACLPPQGVGFFSARAASMIPEGQSTDQPPPLNADLPIFNPHAESPSIRKTPGVDHRSSKPLTKDLKAVSSASQAQRGPANVVNPQLDGARRIGAPGGGSPLANRGNYKPPTMTGKRVVDGTRVPLTDLPANETLAGGGSEAGGEAKRQRLN